MQNMKKKIVCVSLNEHLVIITGVGKIYEKVRKRKINQLNVTKNFIMNDELNFYKINNNPCAI